MDLIEKYFPQYQYKEYHFLTIKNTPDNLYHLMLQADLSKSLLIKFLFWLRGMPTHITSVSNLDKMGFTKLAEKEGEEILFAIVSEQGLFSKCAYRFTAKEFIQPIQPTQIKAVINFSVSYKNYAALVATETRVLCGPAIKKTFSVYWFFIKPFSALIRKRMLAAIKQIAVSN